tara:strand:- start:5 stop:1441 length:1437 start_codon:yes stop_codon:yes gene_type:complete
MKNVTSSLQVIQPSDLAAETNVYTQYLAQVGLPTENIIASTEERTVVASNLAKFLESLPAEEKRDARYLAKFVGASAVGLFDAALNYVWNEVVLNLRKKVSIYGIDLFFDAAVGGKNRAAYKDENDLDGIKDIVLLDTCLKLELISEIVYRKLDHILTMRNEVAASHPNVESIGGFELMGWLQTCVKSVLQDRPSDSAIRIKSFIGNIRERTTVIDEHTKIRFGEELKNLSLPHVHNLLITFFGIFASQKTDQILRKNISIIAPFIWDHSEDRVKYRIGSMIDGYRTNLDEVKLNHGLDFLAVVDGKAYESLPARTVALQNLAIALKEAHNGWDNFYNEPSPMRDILSYCKKSTDIPKELMPTLIPVVLSCRLGRGLSFSGGVSPSGKDLYDQFLKLLDDDGVVQCIISLFGRELNSKLSNPICQNHLGSVIEILKGVTISDRLEDALDFLLDDLSNAHRAHKNQDFQALTKAYIKWN